MSDLVAAGFAIIVLGFVLVFLAVAMSGGRSTEEGGKRGVKGGGVILIGPIPVVFGSDARWASVALVLAIVLIVLVILLGVA